jgi:hypothetical protein
MNDGESNFISAQAIKLIYCKTKPDWAEGDLLNNRREGSLVARHLVSSQQSNQLQKVETMVLQWVVTNHQIPNFKAHELQDSTVFCTSLLLSKCREILTQWQSSTSENTWIFCFLFLLAKDTAFRVCTSFRFQQKFPTCITYIQHFKSEWNVFWYNWYI